VKSMKTQVITPDMMFPFIKKSSFNETCLKFAEKIKERVEFLLEQDDPPLSEISGWIALGISFEDYAKGDMPIQVAHNLMRSLADKKTPNPIAKSESTQTVDVKQTLVELLEGNVSSFIKINELADERRLEVMEKHRTDNLLRLKEEDIKANKDNNYEPEEMKTLRREIEFTQSKSGSISDTSSAGRIKDSSRPEELKKVRGG